MTEEKPPPLRAGRNLTGLLAAAALVVLLCSPGVVWRCRGYAACVALMLFIMLAMFQT